MNRIRWLKNFAFSNQVSISARLAFGHSTKFTRRRQTKTMPTGYLLATSYTSYGDMLSIFPAPKKSLLMTEVLPSNTPILLAS